MSARNSCVSGNSSRPIRAWVSNSQRAHRCTMRWRRLHTMPQGGKLTLAAQGTATQVQLHVRDTGNGIPAAQLPHIFEPLLRRNWKGRG
jgi:signal transduction histidine kinase